MANAGMERDRLIKARRHTTAALDCARPVHHRWILDAATRPKAAELKLAMNQLERALEILREPDGLHWDAANPLEYAAQALYEFDGSELAEVLRQTNLAYREIAEHRPTSGGGSVPY
jgi:hypothetical protein